MLQEKICLGCKSTYNGPNNGSEMQDPEDDKIWGLCCKCNKTKGVNEKLLDAKLKLSEIKRKLRKKNEDVDPNV